MIRSDLAIRWVGIGTRTCAGAEFQRLDCMSNWIDGFLRKQGRV